MSKWQAVEVASLKQRARDAEKDCQRAEGQVARLGCQLGAAHVEVARAKDREEKVRKEAQLAASQAALAQVEAVATLTRKQLQGMRSQVKECQVERSRAMGQMERLGSQLGAALVEAARASESAKEAQTTAEKLRERMIEQEAKAQLELTNVRALKATMAKRARAADKRAGEADTLRAQLDATRERLRAARKELNYTKVQLNLNVSDELCNSSENESDDENCRVTDCHSSDDEEAREAALALKRIRSMPSWRAVRGKGEGKGEAKLEWGTRLTIYSLLAMMVPPAAIGKAIVAIVKRTAPWLNPSAPTYETIKRCRFELRFVEEV